ncbi:MAG: hypothetical protein L0Z68_03615 [Gammaproteobacteria bacterium]|nr:hypothetical protein [Gammaproteobacteria bacterium]
MKVPIYEDPDGYPSVISEQGYEDRGGRRLSQATFNTVIAENAYRWALGAMAACLLTLLTGCMTSAQTLRLAPGVPFDRGKIAGIKPGVTTFSEVLNWFGPPDYIIDGTKTVLGPIPPPYLSFQPTEESVQGYSRRPRDRSFSSTWREKVRRISRMLLRRPL